MICHLINLSSSLLYWVLVIIWFLVFSFALYTLVLSIIRGRQTHQVDEKTVTFILAVYLLGEFLVSGAFWVFFSNSLPVSLFLYAFLPSLVVIFVLRMIERRIPYQ